MMHLKIIMIFGLIIINSLSFGQTDSLIQLSFEQYLNIVSENHPVAVQSKLKTEYGEAAILKAKGGFDPKISTDVSQKYFGGKQYYSMIDGGMKIPTWFGIDFKAGYEVNDGLYLNDQNRTPNSGLFYAGISVPIGQGLIIDKRRAELKKAKIFNEGTELQRRIMINNLLLEAGMIYWNWFRAYQDLEIYENAYTIAYDRFLAVRQLALLGDRPFIDTIEAGLQVQSRTLQLQQTKLVYANTTALLSIYLWSEGAIPLELEENVLPLKVVTDNGLKVDSAYYLILDSLIINHPELNIYENKIDQLAIQKKWNQEQLKPTVNLKYNPITEQLGANTLDGYSINNYTWGLTFNMPIMLRKERGDLKMTNISIQETELNQVNKEAQLVYKAKIALNEWQTTYQQVLLYEQTVKDSKALLDGEWELFNGGESSLFMVNKREQYFIQAKRKLVELKMKNKMAKLKTKFALGLLI